MYIALGKQSYPFGDKCYNYIFNTVGENNWIFIFLQTYRNNRSSIVLIPALGYFFVSEKSITCIFIIIIYPWCEMIEIIIKLITKHFPHSTLLPPSHFGKNLCQLQTDRQTDKVTTYQNLPMNEPRHKNISPIVISWKDMALVNKRKKIIDPMNGHGS